MLAFLGNQPAQATLGDCQPTSIKLKRFYDHTRTSQPFLMVALFDPIDQLCKSLSTGYLSEAHEKTCLALEESKIDPSIFKYGGSGGYLYPHELENDGSLDWFGWVSPEGYKEAIRYHNKPALVERLNQRLKDLAGPNLISGIGYHHYYASNDAFTHIAGLFSLMEWILDDPRDVSRFPDLPLNTWGGILKALAADRTWMRHSPFAFPKHGRPLVAALEDAIRLIDL